MTWREIFAVERARRDKIYKASRERKQKRKREAVEELHRRARVIRKGMKTLGRIPVDLMILLAYLILELWYIPGVLRRRLTPA